jgi:hypothetical protein
MDRRGYVTRPQQGKPQAGGGRRSLGRALGLGLITGAADDNPSAIGTYASAGAKLGHSFLWAAPFTLPMMLSSGRHRRWLPRGAGDDDRCGL